MEKLAAKASKVSSKFLSEKRKSKKARELSVSQDVTKNTASGTPADISIHRCNYCRKAFSHPKYVIKHMLRRHSDKLLALHDHFYNQENSGVFRSTGTFKALESGVNADIHELKQYLAQLKVEIIQLLQTAEIQPVKAKCTCTTISGGEETKTKTCRQKERESRSHDNSIHLAELRSMCKRTEQAVTELDVRYNSLVEAVRQDVQLKEVLAKKYAETDNFIKELKVLRIEVASFREKACTFENQLASLKSSIFSEVQCQNSDFEEKVQQLSEKQTEDIKNLCFQFEEHLGKVNSEVNSGIEKRIEQCLKHYLDKLPKPSKPCERKTAFSVASNCASLKRVVHSNSKNRSKHPLYFKRAKSLVRHNPNTLSHFSRQVEEEIAARMQDIGLSPGCSHLSSKELAAKSRLVENNTRFLRSKYKTFPAVRKKVIQTADDKARLLLEKSAHEKKIVFSTPKKVQPPRSSTKKHVQKQVIFQEGTKACSQGSFEFLVQNQEDHDLPVGEICHAKRLNPQTNSEEDLCSDAASAKHQLELSKTTESTTSQDDIAFGQINCSTPISKHLDTSCTNSSRTSTEENLDMKEKEHQASQLFVRRELQFQHNPSTLSHLLGNEENGAKAHASNMPRSESGSSLQTLDSWDDEQNQDHV